MGRGHNPNAKHFLKLVQEAQIRKDCARKIIQVTKASLNKWPELAEYYGVNHINIKLGKQNNGYQHKHSNQRSKRGLSLMKLFLRRKKYFNHYRRKINMNLSLKKILLVGLISSSLVLGGCSAIGTAVKKRNLEVNTQMSETIWLDPAPQKTVYLQIKNTSDKAMPELPDLIRKEVESKGYTVTNNPEEAYYWIQANVLKADKMDLRDAETFLSGGYEGALVGATIGATAMAHNVNSSGAALGVGLAAGLAGAVIDSMVEDVNYTMITDLQISTANKNTITIKDRARLKQGTSGAIAQYSTEKTHRQKYQTRIVSSANKVNLKYEEAKPELEKQLAQSIANIL